MGDEYKYTYKEQAEHFKKLVHQLEKEIKELNKENDELHIIINDLKDKITYHCNPEDTYREDFTFNHLTFN